MAITEAKVVIEANGQNIYFTSLEDAKKVSAWALSDYKKHHRKVDFKRPRKLTMGKDKDVTFIAIEPESTGSSPYKSLVDPTEPLLPNHV